MAGREFYTADGEGLHPGPDFRILMDNIRQGGNLVQGGANIAAAIAVAASAGPDGAYADLGGHASRFYEEVSSMEPPVIGKAGLQAMRIGTNQALMHANLALNSLVLSGVRGGQA